MLQGNDIPAHFGGVLQIDLDAIKHNYLFIRKDAPDTRCGAVVKANAYGLGAIPISQALEAVGCEDFFVATPCEGQELKSVLKPSSRIYVLNGLYPGAADFYAELNLIPCLNSLDQISEWQQQGQKLNKHLPALLHLDTGLWRAGLSAPEVDLIAKNPDRLQNIDILYYMSHLSCSEQYDHTKNNLQLELLRSYLDKLPPKPVSFTNSHGILLGNQYHFDLLRPGRMLYGLDSRIAQSTNSIKPGVEIFAKLLQVRDVPKGETIGYDATYAAEKDMRIGIIGIGYADGFMRSLTNKGVVYIQGKPAEVIGRVSMDFATIDVTNIPPQHLEIGSWVEIIGEHFSADDLARMAGTNSREITSNLSKRYWRIYKG